MDFDVLRVSDAGYKEQMTATGNSSELVPSTPNANPARPSTDSLHWNAGGWFGSLLGCTLWMIVGVFAVAPERPLLAASFLGLFVLAVVIGVWLYRKRDSIELLRAMQLYMLSFLAISLVYLALAAGDGALELVERSWGNSVALPAWTVPSCYLVCLLVVSYLDWSRRSKRLS